MIRKSVQRFSGHAQNNKMPRRNRARSAHGETYHDDDTQAWPHQLAVRYSGTTDLPDQAKTVVQPEAKNHDRCRRFRPGKRDGRIEINAGGIRPTRFASLDEAPLGSAQSCDALS
jgi:hypothetical protein